MEQITVYLKLNDPQPFLGFVQKIYYHEWRLTDHPLRADKDVVVLHLTGKAFVRLAAFTFKETHETARLTNFVGEKFRYFKFFSKITLICSEFFNLICSNPIAYDIAKTKLLELYDELKTPTE